MSAFDSSNAEDPLERISCIPGLTDPRKVETIAALFEATKLPPRELGRFALRTTPEDCRLVRRDALVEQYFLLGFFSLGRALARRSTNSSSLLVVACDDSGDGVRFSSVSMALLRAIFSSPIPGIESKEKV
jgi:hypothetical protein